MVEPCQVNTRRQWEWNQPSGFRLYSFLGHHQLAERQGDERFATPRVVERFFFVRLHVIVFAKGSDAVNILGDCTLPDRVLTPVRRSESLVLTVPVAQQSLVVLQPLSAEIKLVMRFRLYRTNSRDFLPSSLLFPLV